MPPLAPEIVDAHSRRTEAFAAAFDATPVERREAFVYVQRRILIEAAAAISPSVIGGSTPLLPIRARLIDDTQISRRSAAEHGLRHVDERIAMIRLGHLSLPLDAETPYVLHAFVEAVDIERKASNGGLVRATSNVVLDHDDPFVPAPPGHCRRLLRDAVEMATSVPAPALTRAMWLLGATFAIHPFVDGNGRTARLMMHALLSAASPIGIDWGTIPEFATHRHGYVEHARQVTRPSRPGYDARLLRLDPLMAWAAERAVAGLDLVAARLAHVDRLVGSLVDAYGPVGGLVVFGVHADRNATLDDLARLVPEPDLTRAVNELVALDVLTWDRYGYLQVTGHT